jgi:Asp-tRNA(Asn)/Glu-tRNA(Gln) amidotransferase A subunit family amidase
MAWETDNLLYGRTNNPWDITRTAGGSSGGEAAAIAAGMSAAGVGSDGGGSIRVPAHFSGICGLKPTPGRIPSTGHYPASAGPFALIGVVGPMARTVADVKALFEAVQGPDVGDTCSAPVPARWPDGEEIKELRIGCFEDDGRTPVTAERVRQFVPLQKPYGTQDSKSNPSARKAWRKRASCGGIFLASPAECSSIRC